MKEYHVNFELSDNKNIILTNHLTASQMRLLNLKVFTAIQGGDLKALKEILEIATGK